VPYLLSVADAGRVARIGVRRFRGALRAGLRPYAGWDEELGPVRLRAGTLQLRPPRVGDAAGWRSARLANRRWLEERFPADTADWADGQSALAWTQRCLRLRAAARAGRAFPYVALLDGRLVGEIGVDAVDRGTSTGELSVWTDHTARSGRLVTTGTALVVLHALTCTRPVQRVIAPVAVGNAAPARALEALGFDREATLRRLRDGVDHHVWVLHDTAAARAQLRACITR
jgi:ribosomal-protein-alanine N-acetyltransferase